MAKPQRSLRTHHGVPSKATPLGGEQWVETGQQGVLVMQVYCCWGWDPEACNHKGFKSIDCCCFTCRHSMITAFDPINKDKEVFLFKNRGAGTHDSR